MMTARPEHKFRWIRETVNMHCGFLREQGFRVVSVIFTGRDTEDWQVMMLSDDRFVRLRCDRGKVTLGLSSMQIQDQVGFFDLEFLLQLTGRRDEMYDELDDEWNNEEQQIREITRLFREYSNEIFLHFELLRAFILDRLWSISDLNPNGRLSMDNRPFTFSVNLAAVFLFFPSSQCRANNASFIQELRRDNWRINR